jgi:hypothetical protein
MGVRRVAAAPCWALEVTVCDLKMAHSAAAIMGRDASLHLKGRTAQLRDVLTSEWIIDRVGFPVGGSVAIRKAQEGMRNPLLDPLRGELDIATGYERMARMADRFAARGNEADRSRPWARGTSRAGSAAGDRSLS